MNEVIKKSLLRELVTEFLADIGVTQKLKGYHFIIYGITEILNDHKCSGEIIKIIANEFRVKDRVIHDNIRYAIHTSWNTLENKLNYLFEGIPSPKAFLIEISEVIQKDIRYKKIVFSS